MDHLDFDPTNDVAENLVPTCNICNRHRLESGARATLKDDELVIVNSNGSKTRAEHRTCEICGTGFVARSSQVKIGKGRFCSRSCARRSPRRVS